MPVTVPEATDQNTPIPLDPILAELKPLGWFNIWNYFLLMIPIYFTGLYASAWLFESLDIEYRCRIPICEKLPANMWMKFAIPKEGGRYSKCNQYTQKAATCEESSFWKPEISCRNGYVYEGHISIVQDFDLGCRYWERAIVGTVHNTGLLVAIPISGVLSDTYGRKKVLAISTAMNAVFGIIRSFSNTYIMFIILEFLEPATGGGAYTTAFVTAMELVEPRGRIFGSAIVNCTFVSGLISVAGLAWWLQDWRTFLRVVYTPGLFIISYIFILNESTRWLLSRGRNEEAVKILYKAAKMNNVTLSEEKMQRFEAIKGDTSKSDKDIRKSFEEKKANIKMKIKGNFIDAVKSGIIRRRIAICSFLWSTCTFIYYGMSIYSIALAGNMYINFMFACAVELPADVSCIFILRRFGRKRPLMTFYLLSGALCTAVTILPNHASWIVLPLFLMSKFAITIAYCTVHVFVAEVFPTNLRQSLFALCSCFGQIGSATAPLTPLLQLHHKNLPAVFFGVLAIVSALVVLMLPETHNIALPFNIQEAENLNKNQR